MGVSGARFSRLVGRRVVIVYAAAIVLSKGDLALDSFLTQFRVALVVPDRRASAHD